MGDSHQKRYILNGVADYANMNNEAVIVLQLDQKDDKIADPYSNFVGMQDYYIGFNRAAGVNRGTAEDPDTVEIVRKLGDPLTGGQSWKVAALSLGQSYVITDFNDDPGKDIEVKFAGLANDGAGAGRDAYVDITNLFEFNGAVSVGTNVDCRKYVVTVKTDKFPRDTVWSISGKGGIGESYENSDPYTEKQKMYTKEVWLPFNKCFLFTITDK